MHHLVQNKMIFFPYGTFTVRVVKYQVCTYLFTVVKNSFLEHILYGVIQELLNAEAFVIISTDIAILDIASTLIVFKANLLSYSILLCFSNQGLHC